MSLKTFYLERFGFIPIISYKITSYKMFLKTFIALLFLIRIRKVPANLPDYIYVYM